MVLIDGTVETSAFINVTIDSVGLRLGRVVVVGKVDGLSLHGAYASVLEEELQC
jgi:hypothetical protein